MSRPILLLGIRKALFFPGPIWAGPLALALGLLVQACGTTPEKAASPSSPSSPQVQPGPPSVPRPSREAKPPETGTPDLPDEEPVILPFPSPIPDLPDNLVRPPSPAEGRPPAAFPQPEPPRPSAPKPLRVATPPPADRPGHVPASLWEAAARLVSGAMSQPTPPLRWAFVPTLRRLGGEDFEDDTSAKVGSWLGEAVILHLRQASPQAVLLSQEKLEQILAEQGRNLRDVFSPEGRQQVGQLLKGDVFLFSGLQGPEGYLALDVVDATTGASLARATGPPPLEPPPPRPPLRLTVQGELLRPSAMGNPERAPLRPGAVVTENDQLYLAVEASEPVHLYVFLRSSQKQGTKEVTLLFPVLPGSPFYAPGAPANPIPAATAIEVPAPDYSFLFDDHPGEEIFLVLASRRALPEVERLAGGMVTTAT